MKSKEKKEEVEMKSLVLIAALITIIELLGFKGLLHLVWNIVALLLFWGGLNLASDLSKKIQYPYKLQ